MRNSIPRLIATIGPTTANPDIIKQLSTAGMEAGRLNMSHGTHQSHSTYIAYLRDAQVPVMIDLSGPRTATQDGHAFDPEQPALTEKDRFDLAFAAQHNVDWIILSYVKDEHDVNRLKDEMKKHKLQARIAVKIEHQTAVNNLTRLIPHVDIVIAARGDLGDAVGLEHIGATTLQVVTTAQKSNKPVIVATEILTSMIDAQQPTRAEATDAWLHGYTGASGIMLSNETAIGKHPLEAVQWGTRLFTQGQADRRQGSQLFNY